MSNETTGTAVRRWNGPDANSPFAGMIENNETGAFVSIDAFTSTQAALSAQAAEIARLRDALKVAEDALARAVSIIANEWGYDFNQAANWLFDQTGKHYVLNDDPESIAVEQERIAAATSALAQIREARDNVALRAIWESKELPEEISKAWAAIKRVRETRKL